MAAVPQDQGDVTGEVVEGNVNADDGRPDGESLSPEIARIYLADGDAETHNFVARIAERMGVNVECHRSGQALLDSINDKHLGCILLEVRLPEIGGLLLLERLRERGISLPVLFLTSHGTIPLAVQAILSGAVDFLQKPCRDQDLWDAISRAFSHHDRLRRRLQRECRTRELLAKLSNEEQQVLARLMEGKPNRVTAKELDVSVRTIEIRRANLMRKLGVETLPELFRLMYSLPENGHQDA
ncbi:MAG TPA: response regulator [Planctomycetaceae bacterium]|nr:response regulator [Planctomycetaceae bacterium]